MNTLKLKEFSEYLMYIGLITENTLKNFKQIYDFLNKKKFNKNILKLTLENYIKNLTKNNLSEISNNMINIYLINKKKVNQQILLNALKIKFNYKNKIKKYFIEKWKKTNNDLLTSKINSSISNISNVNCDINSSKQNEFFTNKVNYENIFTLDKPFSLDNNTRQFNNSQSKLLYDNNNNIHIQKPISKFNKFINRQEDYAKLSHIFREKILKDVEDEHKLIYTFNPKINKNSKSFVKYNKPVYIRLYNESIEKNKLYSDKKINKTIRHKKNKSAEFENSEKLLNIKKIIIDNNKNEKNKI